MNEKLKFLGAVEIFLLTNDRKKVLLLKRGFHRKVLPGYYAGIGGKMDTEMLENPLECALREIDEESGIKESDIESLKLKSIITALDKFGRWFVYEFVGILKKEFLKELQQSDEGELSFFNIDEIEELNLIPDLKQGFLKAIITEDNFYWVKSYFDDNNNFIKKELIKS